MIYLTKEFYYKNELCFFVDDVTSSEKAEKFDEDYYQQTYAQELKNFIKYRKKILASDKSGNKNIDIKYETEYFDARLSRYNDLLNNTLPDYIKDEIADMRILTLGYAGFTVNRLLHEYTSPLRSEILYLYSKSCERNVKACSNSDIDLFISFGSIIENLNEENSVITIEFNDKTLILYDAVISKAEQFLEAHKKFDYYENCSKVAFFEIEYYNDHYSLHFLIENRSSLANKTVWEMIIDCNEIKVIEN